MKSSIVHLIIYGILLNLGLIIGRCMPQWEYMVDRPYWIMTTLLMGLAAVIIIVFYIKEERGKGGGK